VVTVNNWFDVHNSSQQYGNHPGVNGFGVDLNNQELSLRMMSMYMHQMKVGKRKTLMPFQKGVIISNSSLRELHIYLQEKYPSDYKYILSRRLQQDILENFFAYIRAMGSCKDHPSAYEFRHRLRWYILGKHSHAVFSMNTNTEEDLETSCISSSLDVNVIRTPTPFGTSSTCNQLRASTPMSGTTLNAAIFDTTNNCTEECPLEMAENSLNEEIVLTEELFRQIIDVEPEELSLNNVLQDATKDQHEEVNVIHFNQTDEELRQFVKNIFDNSSATAGCATASDVIQEAGLQYVAGYVAHRFRTKYPFLGQRTCNIEGEEKDKDWVKVVSKGYLTYPSEDLLKVSKIVEDCFIQFHGDYFSTEDGVIKKVVATVTKKVKSLTVPEEVVQCLVRTLTFE